MSRWLRRFAILSLLPVVLVTTVFYPKPQTAEAGNWITCANAAIAFGRQRWCGYFSNNGYDNGQAVRNGGMPVSTKKVDPFITMVVDDLHSGDAHRVTGAQFLILTMIGRGPGGPKSVTEGPGSQLEDWKSRVKSYADQSENSITSVGQNGRIDWNVWTQIPCTFYKNWGSSQGWYGVNTYYQRDSSGGANDVAPYLVPCGAGTSEEFVLFRDTSGNIIYRIRRACLNPIGQIGGLDRPQDRYDLHPAISVSVDGAPASGGAEVGQTISFTYSVRNSGPDPSPANTSCTIYTNVYPGFASARANPAPGGGAGPPTGCPRSFAANSNSQLGAVELVPVNAGNRTICRSLFVSPATAAVASLGTEVCVPVVNKPYFKVYGGDLSVGNGLADASGACVGNNNAAIIGWNRGAGGGYGGAGTQFAEVALGRIFEAATAVGNAGPNRAAVPRGLAFAGNNLNTGLYGGSFGSLPCTADYYGRMPAANMSFVSLAASTTSGPYSWNGPAPLVLSGVVPASRITLYVNGNVFINNNITYPANWTSGSTPLFQLVVNGDIFIRNGVSRIDGVYIAQKSGATGGTIYTCALGASALVPDGQLYSRCNNKLTVNGAFIANQVRFLRTNGTRQQGSGNEAGGSGNIAEVFNFSPALWMGQPVGQIIGSPQYDSITSLPPIL